MRREIVKLGLQYGLVSKHTSYVAVEHRAAEPVRVFNIYLGPPPIYVQPSLLQGLGWGQGHGWGATSTRPIRVGLGLGSAGAGRGGGRGGGGYSAPAIRPCKMSAKGSACGSSAPRKQLKTKAAACKSAPKSAMQMEWFADCDEGDDFVTADMDVCPALPGQQAAESDPLQRLIMSQAFDGCFELGAVAAVVGVPASDLAHMLPSELSASGVAGPLAVSAWATALAVVFITKTFAASRDSWVMVVSKATKWLARTLPAPAILAVDGLLGQASTCLRLPA